MALIECAECGNKVSSLAEACPSCGAPTPKPQKVVAKQRSHKKLIFGFLVIGFVYWAVSSSNKDKELEQAYLSAHPYTPREEQVRDHFGECYTVRHIKTLSAQQQQMGMALNGCHDDDRDDPLYSEWDAISARVAAGVEEMKKNGR